MRYLETDISFDRHYESAHVPRTTSTNQDMSLTFDSVDCDEVDAKVMQGALFLSFGSLSTSVSLV